MKLLARLLFALPVVLSVVLPVLPAAAAEIAGPRLQLSTRSLSFETPGQQKSVRLENLGDAPVLVRSPRILAENARSDFFIRPVGPLAIAPGQSATLEISYRPSRPLGGPGQPRQILSALQLPTNDETWPRSSSKEAVSEAEPGPPIASLALVVSADPPLLSWIVFFPLLGIPFILLLPASRAGMSRGIALLTTLVPLCLSLVLYRRFDESFTVAAGNHGLQFIEHLPWIRGFGIEYFVAVDGLSLPLVVLTALISVIAVGASWSIPPTQRLRGYFALLLLLEVGMMGVFVALDFFLFFVFWEVMLLPMYFLIGIWGGPRKEYAAIKFFLYTLFGSVLMLVAIIAIALSSDPSALVDGTPVGHSFNLLKLAYANDFGAGSARSAILGLGFAKTMWVLLFIAFAIKVPIVPLHTWLPDAHVEAPTAISVILAGILLKMGPYAMLRINWMIFPEATRWAAEAVAILGVVSILYGAFCAMGQKDLKRLVAYSSITHMGFCLLGMAAFTPTGLSGALVQMFNHGIITSVLFLLVGVLYDRTSSRELDDFGGLARAMPRYAAIFGLGFMASLGLPGLSGFIGEVLVLLGAFPVYTVLTALAALSLVITAAYHLTAIQKIQLGPFNEKWRVLLEGRDLTARETATLLPLAILIVLFGFWPLPLLDTIAGGVKDVLDMVGGR